MKQNKTLIEKLIPTPIKYIAFIIGLIVDSVSLFNLYNELTKDTPRKIILFGTSVFIMLTVVIFIVYFIIKAIQRRTLSLSNLNKTMSLLHDINHIIRNELEYLIYQESIENYDIRSIRKNVRDTTDKILNKLSEFFKITMNQNISVCLKDIRLTKSNYIKDQFLNNLARSDNSHKNRKKAREPIPIMGNSDFEFIYDPNIKSSIFSCGDLIKKFDKEEYKNTTDGWNRYYNSTICVPIRYELMSNNEDNIVYDIIGFLCIDSLSCNKEWEDQDHFAIQVLCSVADSLYPYIKIYKKFLIKQIEMEEVPA